MLRMSKLADYGTVILTTMVREPERIQSALELATHIRVPVPTVSKILKILTREGLVLSLRGAKGGYLLARPASQISIAQIISAMDGPIGMTECSITPGLCSQESYCQVRANWQSINSVVMQALQQVSLQQMTQPRLGTIDISALQAPRPPKKTASKRVNGEQA